MVLHPHAIAASFLKFSRGRRGRVLFLLYPPREKIIQRNGDLGKKLSFMHTKRFNKFFKRCVQFCMVAITRLPYTFCIHCKINFFYLENNILFWSLSSAFTSKTWNCKTKVSFFSR